MGTALRGEHPTPTGHIATKWVVFFYLPLIPIRSYEILSDAEVDYQNWFVGYSRASEFRYRPVTGGWYWPQVRPTLFVILAVVLLPILFHVL